jgi:hypothetical protein
MDRSYVKEYIDKAVIKLEAYLTAKEKDDLIDSILFDWNELGSEGDFEELVDWNVEQYLTHSGRDSSLKRLELDEVRNFIPFPKEWFEVSYKPKPKYFMLRTKSDGWDEVYYYLDAKNNSKKYSLKLLE